MSDEDDPPWLRYRTGPKPPPPARGLKVKQLGATWWGRRWLDALERISGEYASRLGRGRTYARAGRVHDLEIGDRGVTAQVTGSHPRPYQVTIEVARLDDDAWARAIEAMAARAEFTAELLDGRMPEAIDEAFAVTRRSLFPNGARDLDTACSCPDAANPCKHVAATHYVLGEALDRDPFLLLELRGRDRDRVIAALAAARAAAAPAPSPEPRPRPRRMRAAEYDAWAAPPPRLGLDLEAPRAPGALLRGLGSPPGWSRADTPADLLGPIVAGVAARTLAAALATAPSDPAPRPGRAGGTRRSGKGGGAGARRR